MKYIYFLFAIVLLSSCERNHTGSVTLQFNGVYQDEPLVMNTPLDFRSEYQIRFDKSNFYVTNITIFNEDNEAVEIAEVELVELTAFDLATSQAGVIYTYNDIPVGKYNKIELTIGVSPELNSTMPSDYPSTHPLNESGQYWAAWNSYIFCKFEGATDTLQNQSFDQKFAYHTGSDALARTLTGEIDLEVVKDGTDGLRFILDHYDIFKEGEGVMNIKDIPSNHTADDLENMEKIMDNFPIAFKQLL